jgi:hypothetical protein
MDIVEENGSFTGLSFHPPALSEIPQMLARANIFGLSNTTYRTDMLRRLPPAPAQCRLMDWFMATAAWAQGASFSFEKTPQMQYRQYGQNTARILPPFTADDICRATALVVEHYKHVLAYIPEIPTATRTALEAEQARVQRFADRIVQSLERIERYVTGINQLPATHIWWDYVAHPSLESQWKD